MQILEIPEDLAYISILLDDKKKFLGIYGIPSRGGYYWVNNSGDYGSCETEREAKKAILISNQR